MRLIRCCAGLMLLGCAGPAAARVVVLQATAATVAQPGDRGDVCVGLDSGGAEVAGTQNDLVWDGSCAKLPDASACRVNDATGKELLGTLAPQGHDFAYRALVLSLTDVDPLPDGELYCCAFQVDAAPGECCAIAVVNTGASDPEGKPLRSRGGGGHLCVAGSEEVGTPTPTATPAPGSAIDDDDGCQVGPRPARAPAALWVLPAVLWLWARRRRVPTVSSAAAARAPRPRHRAQ